MLEDDSEKCMWKVAFEPVSRNCSKDARVICVIRLDDTLCGVSLISYCLHWVL